MKQIILQDEILIKTFDQMPNEFSSKQFCKLARYNGFSQEKIEADWANVFLTHHCERPSKFMRIKKQRELINGNLFNEDELKKKEIESIKFLKGRGFKIMKQEYVEI